MEIIINRVVCGNIDTKAYIVSAKGDTQAVVIDPASSVEIISELEKNNLTCGAIVLTHGHFDHILGVDELRNKYNAKVYIHAQDGYMLGDVLENFSRKGTGVSFTTTADVLLEEGDEIKCGNLALTVMHTPGHTKGGISLITQGVIFSGDTLFYRSCGRSDFAHSNDVALENSFKKLYALEGDFAVYPGHGKETTLEFERKNNLYIRAK